MSAPRLAVALAALCGCVDQPSILESGSDGGAARADVVRFWDSNAVVYWNEVARDLVVTTNASTPFAIRAYAVMSVAQYQAAVASEKLNGADGQASVHAAISTASVVTLSYLFPAKAAELEDRLRDYLAQATWPGKARESVAAGDAVGRSTGQQMVARAQADRFFAPWSGTVPVGPGVWFSSTVPPTPPAGAQFGEAMTFMLASGSQFRPAPPPAFGSAEFASAVAEVRSIADARTPEQAALAAFWHLPVGTYAPPGYWNEEASKLAVKYRLTERESARVLALMNIVSFDGLVASHEAKYTYWLLRPSQADPGISLAVPLPNFPSYPSNHATISAGSAKILAHMFPAERARLEALAEEAAFSRVLGGIHYRFDGDAGIRLGRMIADYVLGRSGRGHEPLELRSN